MKLLKRCQHEHVNSFYGAYLKDDRVWLILGYCAGSVLDVMRVFKSGLTEPEIKVIANQCLKGIQFLHTKCEIVHRDIKAANLFLTDEGQVVVGDLGIGTCLDERGKAQSFVGSPFWMAPEVIMAMETGTYSYPSDLWSFGITLIELAEEKPPLIELHHIQALFQMMSVMIPMNRPPGLKGGSKWSEQFHSLLANCLTIDPNERQDAGQLLEHPFVKDVGGEDGIKILGSLVNRSQSVEAGELDLSSLMSSGLVQVSEEPELPEDTEYDDGGHGGHGHGNGGGGKSSMQPGASSSARQGKLPQLHGVPSVVHVPAIPPILGAGASDASEGRASPLDSIGETHSSMGTKTGTSLRAMIKLPFQIALEEKAALEGEQTQWQAQQKEMSKLFKKQHEALKKLTGKHEAEITALKQHQESKLQAMESAHETTRIKDDSKAKQAIDKETGQYRKHAEAIAKELKRTGNKSRKQFEKQLKANVAIFKKEELEGHGGITILHDKAQKQALKVRVEAMIAAETADVLAVLTQRDERELQLYEMKHGISKIRMISRHKKEGLELHDKQRLVELALIRDQKTGLLLSKAKEHCLEVNKLQQDHIESRHDLERASLEETHKKIFEDLQKSHQSASKTLRVSLRKLPGEAEEISALLNRKRSQNKDLANSAAQSGAGGSGGRGVQQLAREVVAANEGSSWFRGSLSRRQMQRVEREELRSVKEGHIRSETMKLNVKQSEILASQRSKADVEFEQLQRYHARQRSELLRMQEESILAIDNHAQAVRTATDKYIATEEKSRAKTAELELSKRLTLATKLIAHKESVIEAAKVVLATAYATPCIVRSSILQNIVGSIDAELEPK